MKRKISKDDSMKILFAIIVNIISFIFLVSCERGHAYPQYLVYADSLCISNPAKAVSFLKTIPSEYANEYDKNYYELLKIKALNNAYYPVTDSVIFRINDFFKKVNDKEKLCESYYYIGKYYISNNDAPQAIDNFLKALDNADKETTLLSSIYNQCGRLYLNQELYDEALEMYRKSFSCDSARKDTVNMIHNMRDISSIYSYKNNQRKRLYYLKQAFQLSSCVEDIELQKSIYLALAVYYNDNNNMVRAKRYLQFVLYNITPNIKSPAYALALEIYGKEKQKDSILTYSEKLLKTGTIYSRHYALEMLSQYYIDKKDDKNALSCLRQCSLLADSINRIKASEALAKTHALYNYGLREKENVRLKTIEKEHTYLFVIVLLLATSVILLLVFFNERNKKRCMQFKILSEHLNTLKENAVKQNNMLKRQNEENKIIYTKKINELREKSKEEKAYYENSIREKIRANELLEDPPISEIYSIIQKNIDEKKGVYFKDWKKIDAIFCLYYADFKTKLFDMYKLKPQEYKLCVLVKLGFNNTDIATILCRTTSTVSLARTRLFRKLFNKEGKAKDFDAFIKSL